MKKTFCDICESPAVEETSVRASFPWGSFMGAGIGASIEAHLIFRFNGHPQGFGGPPDLCNACRANMVEEILRRVRGVSGSPPQVKSPEQAEVEKVMEAMEAAHPAAPDITLFRLPADDSPNVAGTVPDLPGDTRKAADDDF